MDKIPEEKQKEIKKLSTPRLVAKLMKVGYEEEALGEMSREQLMEEWAECVGAGVEQPQPTAAECSLLSGQHLRWLMLICKGSGLF
jgi:hypothetical protein